MCPNSTGVVFSKLLALQKLHDIPDESKQPPPPITVPMLPLGLKSAAMFSLSAQVENFHLQIQQPSVSFKH